MDGLMRFPRAPVAGPRLGGSPPITSNSQTGYPWVDGDILYAADLNAAVAASSLSVLEFGAVGDGTTDDTAAIQAALTACAGKTTVFIPDTGNPYMVNPLSLPTGTDLLVYGTLMGKPGAPNGVLVIQSCSNVTVRGYGTIDGNDPLPAAGNGAVACIVVSNATNVQISGVTLQHAHDWNLNVVTSTRVVVDRVSMFGGHASPEFASGSTDCWITNSYINGPYNDGGFAFYGGVTNSGAIGNVFTNAAQYGCSIICDPGQSAACYGITISNNMVFNNGFTAIAVLSSGLPVNHALITISDNVIYNNNTQNSAFASGAIQACDIWLSSCTDVVVSGNKLHHCGSGAHGGHGIVLGGSGYGAAFSLSIVGNDISNEGQGTTTGVGIYLGTPAGDHIMISGNHIYDDQGTRTMVNAIAGTAGPWTAIIGNHFGATLGTSVAVTPMTDTIIANAHTAGGEYVISSTLLTVAPQAFANASKAPRWFVGNDSSTESGGDSGSNFEIVTVHDSGAIGLNALGINRATGVVTFGVTPAFATPPVNYANDAAASAGGVAVGGIYRNGSVLQVRVT